MSILRLKSLLTYVVFCGALTAACSSHRPSPEDPAEIARLDSLRAQIAVEINAAREDEAQWAGGLVGALASARRRVLETTDAMVQQRREAIRAGADFSYTQVALARDSGRARDLEREIATKRGELADAERETARQSSVLLEGLARVRAMTVRQTLAMLEQSRLVALYGLPLPPLDTSREEPSSTATSGTTSPAKARPTRATAPSPPSFEIVDVSTKVTEQNEVFWRYAWRLTLKSRANQPLSLQATIEFQDAEGFVIDTDDEYNLYLEPGEQKAFTGYAMITASTAADVTKVNAKVRR